MKLTVPFITDNKYIRFLENNTSEINSVYFSLHSTPVLDARMKSGNIGMADLLKGLQQTGQTKKYGLLNTRFIHPRLYRDHSFLTRVLDCLEALYSHALINGVVFSDFYFLNALSGCKRDFLSHLEAVPGINMMIDSFEKAFSLFDIIEKSCFRLPEKIILDRSLNRDLKQLKKISGAIKSEFPGIQIELLANEGCIYHCPFKFTHDAQISFSNTGLEKNNTHRINTDIGCYTFFYNAPETFLKSPFIRPEDAFFYEAFIDSIKICGRTLGPSFLIRCITAYMDKHYHGNLLNLMDATHWFADHYHIDNKRLDPGFFKQITRCTKVCKTCRICADLFKKVATQKSVTIKSYKDYL